MSFADEFDERGREARVDEAALSRVLQAEEPPRGAATAV